MDGFLNKFHFLKSRKFWTFIGGVAGIFSAAAQVEPFPVTEVIVGIVTLATGYMTTTAWEDTARSKAEVNATVTTVSTPGASDVQVTAPPDTSPVTLPEPLVNRHQPGVLRKPT